MTVMTIFKSRAATMGYVFRSGKSVHFLGGQYATTILSEIEELTQVCNDGHYNFYIDPECKTLDSELLDPLEALRAKIREEERAKLLAATDPSRDMGKTDASKLEGIANSSSIRGLQVSSNGTPVAVGAIKVGSSK